LDPLVDQVELAQHAGLSGFQTKDARAGQLNRALKHAIGQTQLSVDDQLGGRARKARGCQIPPSESYLSAERDMGRDGHLNIAIFQRD
jgi:hypothetical protein